MKLIPLTDLVLQVVDEDKPCDRGAILDQIATYAEFLKQPLKLEMFVPCDEEGNVLNGSDHIFGWEDKRHNIPMYTQVYLKAKEKVLFEGFNTCICNNETAVRKENRMPLLRSEMENMTIEDLVKGNLTLNPSTIKQLGL